MNPDKRRKLNNLYHKLSYYEKSIFHGLFSRIFRDGKSHEIDGEWILKFAGQEVRIPLTKESLGLDWETAVSVLGHDYEIKSFYEERISSKCAPKCFLDIGANYGTHSLLFLISGIRTVSIEPNPECKPYFEKLAIHNKVKDEWVGIALGEEDGKAQIQFPDGETWLGSLVKTDFSKRKERIKSYPIEVKTLDGFLKKNQIKPDLIKIDTEGFEEGVIKGGQKFLICNLTNVVFEANSQNELVLMMKIFHALNYRILSLKKFHEVNGDNFSSFKKENNFLAMRK
ncbi:FkbM family methyltransferase [Algoriphagus aestuariicola]